MGQVHDLYGETPATLPDWIPEQVPLYLAHTEAAQPIRRLARGLGRHPSTVLRLIRRWEQRRDDPLTDSALTALARQVFFQRTQEDSPQMTAFVRSTSALADDDRVTREARRILRRLCETGAFLAVAQGMDKAAVLKETGPDKTTRIAVVDRDVAEAFALKDWITSASQGRVATYRITQVGRAALKRLLADTAPQNAGFAEAQTPFADQHRDWGERNIMPEGGDRAERLRTNLAESPLALLARRKDRNGDPFLTPELVDAGERLREDFELAQMGPRVAQNWDRFLTAGDRGGFADHGPMDGARGARDRVAGALRDLGPGLGDVVLRCCCYLEGMEAAEKRMGWSARSGKVVLRIALQRLKRHYDDLGRSAKMIG